MGIEDRQYMKKKFEPKKRQTKNNNGLIITICVVLTLILLWSWLS